MTCPSYAVTYVIVFCYLEKKISLLDTTRQRKKSKTKKFIRVHCNQSKTIDRVYMSSVSPGDEDRQLSSPDDGFGSTVGGSVRRPAWMVMRAVVFRAIFFEKTGTSIS